MNALLVREYVNNTKRFFENYASHLDYRSKNINEDIEDTGLMIAWIFTIFKLNIEHIILKLDHFEKDIYVPPNIKEFTYPDLWNILIGGKNQHKVEEKKLSTKEDLLLLPIVQKTTHYLLRARETLALQLQEMRSSAYFIPTEYMLKQREVTQFAYDECLKLISVFQSLISAEIKQNKSWLTRILYYGMTMVKFQRTVFGLLTNIKEIFKNKNLDENKIQPDHKATALNTLKSLVQKLDEPSILFPPTNITQQILLCKNAEDQPQNPTHFDYFPRNIELKFNDVKALIQNCSEAKISAEAVLPYVRKFKPIS